MSVAKEQRQKQAEKRRTVRHMKAARLEELDGQKVIETVAAIAECGGAIRFGYTRDGSAIAVGVYGLGSPYTEYFASADDLTEYLADVLEDLRDDQQGSRNPSEGGYVARP